MNFELEPQKLGLAVHENFGLLRTQESGPGPQVTGGPSLDGGWPSDPKFPVRNFRICTETVRKFRSCCICNMTPGVQDSRDKYVGKLSQEALAAVVAIKGKIAGFKNSKEKGKIILADIDQQTQRNFAFSCSTHCFFLSSVPSIPSGIEIVSLSLATFALFI